MPITIKGVTDSRLGLVSSTMLAFTASMAGTHVQPASRAGSLNPTLDGFTVAFQGQAGTPTSIDGAIGIAVSEFSFSMRGSFTHTSTFVNY